jgi:hypothetical protein
VHVTQIILRTQPGRARFVADLMGQVKGMGLLSVQDDHRVLATWTIPDGHDPHPEGLSEVLRAMSEDVLEVALLGEEERD